MQRLLNISLIILSILLLCLPVNAESQDAVETDGVLIKEILFDGNTVIDTETLQQIAQPFKNTKMTLDDMSSLTDLITMAYQERGYILARAFLKEQEVKDGVLSISIAEGRVGKIEVSGNKYYRDQVIKRYFQQQEAHGVVKESLLEKGLLMTNEIPKVKTNVILKEGEKPGEVDVVLNAEEAPTLTFGVEMGIDYNNYGTDYVGKNRYGASLKLNDHYLGSTLSVRGIFGDNVEDSAFGSVDFAIPVNRYGTKLSVGYLESSFAVGEELVDLGLGGESQFYGAQILQPILKKKNMNMALSLVWDHKYSENTSEETTEEDVLSVDESDRVGAALSFDNLDRFLGKNIISLEFFTGKVNPNLNSDGDYVTSRGEFGTEVDKYFNKLLLRVARIQKLYGYTNLMFRGSGQYSRERLLPFEQFGIGGFGTVRGYNTSLFLGSSCSHPPF
jgi:hemolysin activation/secretion protein